MKSGTLYMLALDYAILQALAYALIRDWLAAHPFTAMALILDLRLVELHAKWDDELTPDGTPIKAAR